MSLKINDLLHIPPCDIVNADIRCWGTELPSKEKLCTSLICSCQKSSMSGKVERKKL